MNIYSIKNEKTGFFNRPIYCESENEALTYIQNVLMSDSDRALSSLKGYLALYYLGYIDFVSGIIDTENNPSKICDLEDIFNTIPADKLKPALTIEHYETLCKAIAELEARVADSSTRIEHHTHNRKDGSVI